MHSVRCTHGWCRNRGDEGFGSAVTLGLLCFLSVSCLGCSRHPGPSDGPSSTKQAQTEGADPLSGEVQLSERLVQRHNRGVALMQQYDFDKARTLFADIAAERPNWTEAQVDLAIATLNRGQKGDYEEASAILDQILQNEPDNLQAAFCRALLFRFFGDPAAALPLFRQVAESDPRDGYAAYYVGHCLKGLAQRPDGQTDMSKMEEAYDQFCRAVQIDPYLRSAYYEAFQTAQRLDRDDEANKYLKQFQELKTNPQARSAEMKYMRMGPKAEVAPIDYDQEWTRIKPPGPVFSRAEPLRIDGRDGFGWSNFTSSDPPPNITVCDIDGNQRVDLYIARALVNGDDRRNAVLLRQDDDFQLDLDHPLARVTEVNAALWGDYDNDGQTDVYLCRRGPNQLWRQVNPNHWQDVTQSTLTDAGDFNTVDGAMFDADHDGDLDLLLVNDDGPHELLNNNLDGTFRPLAKQQGLAGDQRGARGVLVTDLDRDRDVDVVIIKNQPPHEVYLNDRLWKYDVAAGFEFFCQTPIHSALAADSHVDKDQSGEVDDGDWFQIEASVADTDVDGQVELFTLSTDGVIRWAPDATGTWIPHPLVLDVQTASPPGPLAIQDVDGDGRLDLLLSTREGWLATGLRGQPPELFQSRQADLRHWTPVVLDPQRGPSLVGLRPGHPPLVWNPGPGRFPFAALNFTGREEKSEQMRSNASGIGAHVAIGVGGQITTFETYRQFSGPGQSLQPIPVGLASAKRIDFVRVTWPDGIFQTEIDLSAGLLHRIEETQRQVSSCPVVFAWNGRKYEFVTDVLGVGGIGFNVGAGEYADPRPWENVLLPTDVLEAKNGRYEIKMSEPMEEGCYLDAARLVAYDVPPGWKMSLDERFASGEPWPTGQPIFYRQCFVPRRAVNDRGQDVTVQIQDADLDAAAPGKLDRRFVGRTEEHAIHLTFDQPLDEVVGQPVLVMNGWVEYPYSQTMFAAWQAGAEYEAPTVEARAANGEWRVVLDRFGYVAGMPREASVPLPKEKLPVGTTQLRIRTNIEIYWDRLVVVDQKQADGVIGRQLPLLAAIVQETGFAQRRTGPLRQPYYDYDRLSPLWDTQHQEGFYTCFGPALPLLARTDDAVAIIGPGEEVHLEFDATLDPVPAGWTRRLVLETNGWCKDRDPYTKDGATLEPLPRRDPGTIGDARDYERLHRRYNTRYRPGG